MVHAEEVCRRSPLRKRPTSCLTNLQLRNTTMSYDSLRRQARTLEFLVDSKLTSYSRIALVVTKEGNDIESHGSTDRWQDLEAEIEDLLEKVYFWFFCQKVAIIPHRVIASRN